MRVFFITIVVIQFLLIMTLIPILEHDDNDNVNNPVDPNSILYKLGVKLSKTYENLYIFIILVMSLSMLLLILEIRKYHHFEYMN